MYIYVEENGFQPTLSPLLLPTRPHLSMLFVQVRDSAAPRSDARRRSMYIYVGKQAWGKRLPTHPLASSPTNLPHSLMLRIQARDYTYLAIHLYVYPYISM